MAGRARALLAATLALTLSACGFLPLSRTSRAGADVIERAPRPEPVDSEFDGCGPAGSQPDYALNRRKNRVDEGAYLPVPWTVVAHLPWPRQVGYRFRNQWGAGEARQVARYEGAAIAVEGFLLGHKLEVREPPNCYSNEPAHKDYHVWFGAHAGDPEKKSIVVELTPRVRARHPLWTDVRLDSLERARTPVRVSGWLMLDQMHPELVRQNRVTLWEIHPVMRIEWRTASGRWISFDSTVRLPAAGD